jgi:arginyl-tRNA synthetase
MSMNQYFAIKAILTNPVIGATVADIEEFNVSNVPQVISQLRQKGHEVISIKRDGKTFYTLPYGTRDQAAKLSKAQRENIDISVGVQQLFA